jgi:HlyD family secretion protein
LRNVKLKRWLPRIIVFALAAGAAAFLVVKKPWAKGEDPITFSTVTVTKGSIAAQVTANGTLSAVTTVQVGAQVSGRVVGADVDFNASQEGPVIARPSTSVLKSQIDQAVQPRCGANVNKAEVALVDADRQSSGRSRRRSSAGRGRHGRERSGRLRCGGAGRRARASPGGGQPGAGRFNQSYARSTAGRRPCCRARSTRARPWRPAAGADLFTIAEDLARMQIDTAVARATSAGSPRRKATFTVDVWAWSARSATRRPRPSVVTYDAVIDVDNSDLRAAPRHDRQRHVVLAQVADAIKILNPRCGSPSREQLRRCSPSSAAGGRGRRRTGSPRPARRRLGGLRRAAADAEPRDARRGAATSRRQEAVFAGRRPARAGAVAGADRGSSTQMLEGDLEPGDQLITEIIGAPTGPTRKIGAF